MSNYERSHEGPGGISSLPPTIGSPARPYAPQVPQYPAAPVYSAMPQYPAFPAFPKRTGVLRGLAGLLGLGTEGAGFWSQPWFPYAALGALGAGIYFLVKSKGGEGVPTDVLFKNPHRSAPPEDAPTVVHSMYAMMVRSAEANGKSSKAVKWAQGTGGENVWMVGDADGDRGDIVMKPKGDHWQGYHRTGMGDRKLDGKDAADMARDFFE